MPGVDRQGLLGGHGEVVVADLAAAVAPGGVDVVFRTVQGGDGPDVVPLDDGGAPDALQLQKQVIGPGVAVADGGAVCKQAVGNVAEGIVPGLVVVDAVVADPAVVDPGLSSSAISGRRTPSFQSRSWTAIAASMAAARYSWVRRPAPAAEKLKVARPAPQVQWTWL